MRSVIEGTWTTEQEQGVIAYSLALLKGGKPPRSCRCPLDNSNVTVDAAHGMTGPRLSFMARCDECGATAHYPG